MSHIVDYIKREHEEHLKVLQQTEEDAHSFTLLIRRLESLQRFIKEHFPENHHTKKIRGDIEDIRREALKSLEIRQ